MYHRLVIRILDLWMERCVFKCWVHEDLHSALSLLDRNDSFMREARRVANPTACYDVVNYKCNAKIERIDHFKMEVLRFDRRFPSLNRHQHVALHCWNPLITVPYPTIMEKNVGTFYLIQEKISNPRFPNSMLIRAILSEAVSARSPTLRDGDGEGLW